MMRTLILHQYDLSVYVITYCVLKIFIEFCMKLKVSLESYMDKNRTLYLLFLPHEGVNG
jgi:hypothetical protein